MASSLNGACVRSTCRLLQVVHEKSQPVPGERCNHGQRKVWAAAGRGWMKTIAAPGSLEPGKLVSELHWSSQALASTPALSGDSGTSASSRCRKLHGR